MQFRGPRTLILLVLSVAVVPFVAAQTPSHPLSQITPADSDLNLSDNDNANANNLTGVPWIVPRGGSLGLAGDLDLAGNQLQSPSSITSYYGSACSEGEAVADVGDDGSFTCISIAGESHDLYVNRSGDSMTGNLTMNDQWIKSLSDPSSSQDAMTKSFADSAYINRDGTDSMNADLDLDGHNLLNADALGNGTVRTIEMTTGGNVEIPNGDLNISGEDLNFHKETVTLDLASGGQIGETSSRLLIAPSDGSGGTDYSSELTYDPSNGYWEAETGFRATGGDVNIPNGDLGVGLSGPSEKLHVNGTNTVRARFETVGSGNPEVVVAHPDQEWTMGVNNNQNQRLGFNAGNSLSDNEELYIESGGNVDIPNGALAIGSNTLTGLSAGDANISTLYYDTQSAKSPIVSCSQGSDWCEVTIPENQTSFFAKKGEDWDKDRPRETAEEVVDASAVELAERVEEQGEKIEELTAAVCEVNPGAAVCG